MALQGAEQARHQRHLSLPEIGAAGQAKLRAARVLVVGAGGLGSPASLYLAAAGVGTVGLIDADRVELSNLQRQVLFATADVGRPKVEAARERLLALDPGIAVIAHAADLNATNAAAVLDGYDLVLDGTDRLGSRYLVNDACVMLRKPFVTAAIHRFEGQALTYVPGRGPCYRCLFPDAAEGGVPNCADAGVLGVLPGVLGALQATEAIKLIVGAGEPLVGRLLTFDALEMRFREFAIEPRADCAVCGPNASITSLRQLTRDTVRRLGARELQALLAGTADGAACPLVIDVREPREFAAGHLPGAMNVPLAELPGRLAGLADSGPLVFVCRSGTRSLAACEMAVRAGIAAPAHLEGGLIAWAAGVDPSLSVAAAG